MAASPYPYYQEATEVLKDLDVDPRVGLTDEEVQKRRKKYGLNELEKEAGKTMFELVRFTGDDATTTATATPHPLKCCVLTFLFSDSILCCSKLIQQRWIT